MKLGFFTMPIHPLGKDWQLSLQEDREAFLLADELGFTEAYVGEHVTDQAENITSSIALSLRRIEKNRIGLRTRISRIRQENSGFQKIASRTPRAADGVITS